jgi:hypothetical protein
MTGFNRFINFQQQDLQIIIYFDNTAIEKILKYYKYIGVFVSSRFQIEVHYIELRLFFIDFRYTF